MFDGVMGTVFAADDPFAGWSAYYNSSNAIYYIMQGMGQPCSEVWHRLQDAFLLCFCVHKAAMLGRLMILTDFVEGKCSRIESRTES